MTICLAALFYVMRIGFNMRRRRLEGQPPDPSLVQLHLRLAKPFVLFAVLGFVGGAASAVYLRDWGVLGTFHGVVGLVVVAVYSVTAFLGRQVERGEREPVLHGFLGLVSTLLAALAAVAGFVLLP